MGVHKVGVVGAGQMGSGIAQVFADVAGGGGQGGDEADLDWIGRQGGAGEQAGQSEQGELLEHGNTPVGKGWQMGFVRKAQKL